MGSILICKDGICPSRYKCYLYLAKPEKYGQLYKKYERGENEIKCKYFQSVVGSFKTTVYDDIK